MTATKYLILLLTILFSSCGNNPTYTNEAKTHVDKPIVSVQKVDTIQSVDTALLRAWSTFQRAVSTENLLQFRRISFDSINCCETVLSESRFIKTCYNEIFDTILLKKILIPAEINQLDIELELGYFSKFVLDQADFKGDAIILKQFQIIKELTPDGAWTMTFDFIKTKRGYLFFRCDSYGGPICCR